MPGTVGEGVGSSVLVASADEWLAINKLVVENHYLNAAEVLLPGDCLEDGR